MADGRQYGARRGRGKTTGRTVVSDEHGVESDARRRRPGGGVAGTTARAARGTSGDSLVGGRSVHRVQAQPAGEPATAGPRGGGPPVPSPSRPQNVALL